MSPDSNPPTHYSSQDSLPDSPYSSQSLESQPEPSNTDQRRHTRGSMPNLNKRGRGGRAGGGQVGQGLAAPGGGGRKASASATRAPAAGGSGYGLSRHHTSSDPRLQQQHQQRLGRGSQAPVMQLQPPQRGYSMPRGGDRRTPEVTCRSTVRSNKILQRNLNYPGGLLININRKRTLKFLSSVISGVKFC